MTRDAGTLDAQRKDSYFRRSVSGVTIGVRRPVQNGVFALVLGIGAPVLLELGSQLLELHPALLEVDQAVHVKAALRASRLENHSLESPTDFKIRKTGAFRQRDEILRHFFCAGHGPLVLEKISQ